MSGPSSETDIQAAHVPPVVKVGGGVTLGAGALAVLVAGQTISGFSVRGPYMVLLVLVGLVGLGGMIAGFSLMRARRGAGMASLILAVLLFLATSVWLLMSMGGGLLSLFALFAPALSIAAIVLSALSIGPSARVAEARARLASQGLDLGM